MAAQLASRGVVSHRSAAELWGLIDPKGAVEVSVGPHRQPRLLPPATLHRIKDLHPDRAVSRSGLRITDARRTLVDLGLVLPPRHVGQALARALTTRLVSFEEVLWLREALGRQGRNGTGVIGELLEDRRATAGREESVLEARFVDLLAHFGAERPVLQHEVWHGGRFVARIDAAYLDVQLGIEVDGYESRATPEAFRHDRARQHRLEDLGWTIRRFTWRDVTKDGGTVVRRIERTLAELRRLQDLCAPAIT